VSNHPPESRDPQAGPFNARDEAEAAFGHVRRGADNGTFGNVTEFLVAYLTDTIDAFPGAPVELGRYDRLVIHRIASLFDPVDVGVIGSWFVRVMRDVPPDGDR
jgi:hypothetical protein